MLDKFLSAFCFAFIKCQNILWVRPLSHSGKNDEGHPWRRLQSWKDGHVSKKYLNDRVRYEETSSDS